ncbi:alpha/beta hydrolase [soil metagenome]
MKLFLRSLAVLLLLLIVAALGFYRFPLWVSDQMLRFGLWRQGVKSDYVVAGGQRLHYFEAGPANGTPLLLIHGLGARGEDWGKLLPGLAVHGFHVYAPDLLGYGRSAAPDVNYSISLEEQVIVDFMQAVHLTRPDVGGWSMGGWIAMKLALDHPERVDRLVVYDSAGVYFESKSATEVFTPVDVAGVRKLLAALSPKPITLPDFVARDVVRRNGAIAWVIHRSISAMVGGRDLLDFRLQGITRPTLVVWGSRDDLIPLATGETIHQRIAGSSMTVVEGCGHLAPSECWKPVLEGTIDFLRAEPVPRGVRRVFPASAP